MSPKVSVINRDDLPPEAGVLFFDGVYGTYDPKTTDIEVFIHNHPEPVEKTLEVINHEFLHYILHKEVDKEATVALDNIDTRKNSLFQELNRAGG